VWPSMRRVAHHLTACCSPGRSLTDRDEFSVGWRPRGEAKAGEGEGGGAGAGEEALTTAYGAGVHLKSISKRPLDQSGGHLHQWYCPESKAIRSTSVYSACRNPTAGGESFLCGPKTCPSCFADHLRAAHDIVLYLFRRKPCGGEVGWRWLETDSGGWWRVAVGGEGKFVMGVHERPVVPEACGRDATGSRQAVSGSLGSTSQERRWYLFLAI